MAFSAVLYLLLLSSSVLMRAGASDSSYSYATNTPFYGYYTARSHKTNHPATQKKSQQVHYTTAPAYRAPSTRKTYYVTESPQRKKSTHATAYVTSAKSHYSKVPTYTKAGSYASTKKNHYSTGHAPKVYLAPRPLYKRRTKKGPASAGYMKKRSHPTAKSKNQAQSKDYQSYKKSAAPVIYTKPAYKKSISRGEENQLCYKPNKRSQGAPGHPAVKNGPCCDGQAAVSRPHNWGKFCPGSKAVYKPSRGRSGGKPLCYGHNQRNQGVPGHSGVKYGPCCDGQTAVSRPNDWGKFCPDSKEIHAPWSGHGGGNPFCYSPNQRNQGAPGYPAVKYGPCCNGKDSVHRKNDWGKFCPGNKTGGNTKQGTSSAGRNGSETGSGGQHSEGIGGGSTSGNKRESSNGNHSGFGGTSSGSNFGSSKSGGSGRHRPKEGQSGFHRPSRGSPPSGSQGQQLNGGQSGSNRPNSRSVSRPNSRPGSSFGSGGSDSGSGSGNSGVRRSGGQLLNGGQNGLGRPNSGSGSGTNFGTGSNFGSGDSNSGSGSGNSGGRGSGGQQPNRGQSGWGRPNSESGSGINSGTGSNFGLGGSNSGSGSGNSGSRRSGGQQLNGGHSGPNRPTSGTGSGTGLSSTPDGQNQASGNRGFGEVKRSSGQQRGGSGARSGHGAPQRRPDLGNSQAASGGREGSGSGPIKPTPLIAVEGSEQFSNTQTPKPTAFASTFLVSTAPETVAVEKTILESLASSSQKNFTVFLRLLNQTGVAAILNDRRAGVKLTAFVPDDSAFVASALDLGITARNAADAGDKIVAKLEKLVGKKELLKILVSLLKFHISGRQLVSAEILEATEISTLDAESIKHNTSMPFLLKDKALALKDPRLVKLELDNLASNGVYHCINRVLFNVPLKRLKGVVANEESTTVSPRPNYVGSNKSSCFPSSATVQLSSGGTIHLTDLVAGDSILVKPGMYSPVFLFSHRKLSGTHDFIQISTSAGHTITLTAGHYIRRISGSKGSSSELIASQAVSIGDVLMTASGQSAVNGISKVRREGLIAPHTLLGDLMVDGVVASSYTQAVKPVVAHTILAPLRLLVHTGLATEPLGSLLYNGADIGGGGVVSKAVAVALNVVGGPAVFPRIQQDCLNTCKEKELSCGTRFSHQRLGSCVRMGSHMG